MTNLYLGDCLAILQTLEAESIDAVITDPPYGLGFMGKSWDKDSIQFSVDFWKEVLRVLKPGAHLLAFGGTRTYHRMAVAIEDAGFEVRDCLQWLYGSGFPKSLTISKQIDKLLGAEPTVIGENPNYRERQAEPSAYNLTRNQLLFAPATSEAKDWQGWGTALKPANEPILLARKPIREESITANVLAHGTGGLNIDACRIGTSSDAPQTQGDYKGSLVAIAGNRIGGKVYTEGRFPSNVILGCACESAIHDDDCPVGLIDKQSGFSISQCSLRTGKTGKSTVNGTFAGHDPFITGVNDSGGASRFFYVAKPTSEERNEGLEGFEVGLVKNALTTHNGTGDFRGVDKKPLSKQRNIHPTVKPIQLMRYLIRLVTPPGGTVLDPFCGSGTTGCAAMLEKVNFLGIEREADYHAIAQARIAHWQRKAQEQPSLFEGLVSGDH